MNTSLITAEALLERLEDQQWKVFDIRASWGESPTAHLDDYLSSHIKGAYWLDWTKHFIQQDQPLNLALATDKESATQSFAALGIHREDTVILSDNGKHMFACRIAWLMRYFGFKRVKVLSGGWDHWKAAGYPVESTEQVPVAPESDENVPFQATINAQYLATLEEVMQSVSGEKRVTLLDARGEASHKKGSIPGSMSLPYTTFIDESSGCFYSIEKIKALFAERGITVDHQKPIMTTCGSGYTASVLHWLLAEIGIESAMHDGAFAQWRQSPDREVVVKKEEG